MKAENKASTARKSPKQRPPEPKSAVVREWAPQPSLLTREEIRSIVIDQIG